MSGSTVPNSAWPLVVRTGLLLAIAGCLVALVVQFVQLIAGLRRPV